MATYYVDADAGTGGDGSVDTPWDTLSDVAAASGNVTDGDIVNLQGEFSPSSRWDLATGVSYQQWSGETTWTIDASGAGAGVDGIYISGSVSLSDVYIFDAPDDGIVLWGITGTEVVTLTDVAVAGSGRYGFYNYSQSGGIVNFNNCTENGSGGSGFYNTDQSGGESTFSNCTATSSGGSGFRNTGQSGGESTFSNCTATSSGTYGFYNTAQSSGIATFSNCTATSSVGYEFYIYDCDGGSQTVTRCMADRGNSNGIYVSSSTSGAVTITNNISLSHDSADKSDIYVNNSTSVMVCNNTCVGGIYGIRALGTTTGVLVKNNIVKNVTYGLNNSATAGTWDHNHVDHTTGRYGAWDSVAQDTLADFRTASSQEANSSEGDPCFVDASGGDYRLKYDSPCVDAGTDVDVVIDRNGRKRDMQPDMGCYEYRRDLARPIMRKRMNPFASRRGRVFRRR